MVSLRFGVPIFSCRPFPVVFVSFFFGPFLGRERIFSDLTWPRAIWCRNVAPDFRPPELVWKVLILGRTSYGGGVSPSSYLLIPPPRLPPFMRTGLLSFRRSFARRILFIYPLSNPTILSSSRMAAPSTASLFFPPSPFSLTFDSEIPVLSFSTSWQCLGDIVRESV